MLFKRYARGFVACSRSRALVAVADGSCAKTTRRDATIGGRWAGRRNCIGTLEVPLMKELARSGVERVKGVLGGSGAPGLRTQQAKLKHTTARTRTIASLNSFLVTQPEAKCFSGATAWHDSRIVPV